MITKEETKIVASLAPITEEFLRENVTDMSEACFLAAMATMGFHKSVMIELLEKYNRLFLYAIQRRYP
ncbi:MAG: hypothetical protein M0R80_03960 [Proteobacteria bacterium]|jgi:hypothetical protein|nr:hypothetical protein [Pseudomonadota bacterium]